LSIAATYNSNLLHGLRVGTSRTIFNGILVAHNRYIGQDILFIVLIQRVGIAHSIYIGAPIVLFSKAVGENIDQKYKQLLEWSSCFIDDVDGVPVK